jgi:hypothetical protein
VCTTENSCFKWRLSRGGSNLPLIGVRETNVSCSCSKSIPAYDRRAILRIQFRGARFSQESVRIEPNNQPVRSGEPVLFGYAEHREPSVQITPTDSEFDGRLADVTEIPL